MSRTWSELLGDTEPGEGDDEERTGFFSRLRDSLAKSRRALTEQIVAAAFDPADDEAWERLEEALIYADVGATTTAKVVGPSASTRLKTPSGSPPCRKSCASASPSAGA